MEQAESAISARPMLLFSRVLGPAALRDAGDPLLGAPHAALQSAAAGRLAPLLHVLAAVSTIRLRDRRDHAQRAGNDNQSQSHRPSSPSRFSLLPARHGRITSREPRSPDSIEEEARRPARDEQPSFTATGGGWKRPPVRRYGTAGR
jgi:hypothetical protein